MNCGDPDNPTGNQTHLYDVVMSTQKVQASIFKLPHVKQLYDELWYFVELIRHIAPDGIDPNAWESVGRRFFRGFRVTSLNRVLPDHHILSVNTVACEAQA